eukprot:1257664-Pleurochrysis_carterae.AAC.1
MSHMQEISASQLCEHLLRHRQSHAGKEKHADVEILIDHCERAPSLLHHRINSCRTTASIAARVKRSATRGLTRLSWNEPRNLLTNSGLLSGLLHARYASGESDAQEALEALSRAQH